MPAVRVRFFAWKWKNDSGLRRLVGFQYREVNTIHLPNPRYENAQSRSYLAFLVFVPRTLENVSCDQKI